MTEKVNKYVFLDVETSGADPDEAALLELAYIIVDDDFREVSTGSYLINVDVPAALTSMPKIVREMHEESGLLQDLADPDLNRCDLYQAQMAILDRWRLAGCRPGDITLVGFSVQFDQNVLRRRMPLLHWVLSHRIIDLSGVGTVLNKCGVKHTRAPMPAGEKKHRALSDCLHALAEFRAIRDTLRALCSAPAEVQNG